MLDEEKVKRMGMALKSMRKSLLYSLMVILTPATVVWFAYSHGKLASAAEKSDGLANFGFWHHMARVTGAIISLFVVGIFVLMVGNLATGDVGDFPLQFLITCAISTIIGSVINLIPWVIGRRFFRTRPEAHSSVLGIQACQRLIASCNIGITGSIVGLLFPVVTWPVFIATGCVVLGMTIRGLGEAGKAFDSLVEELTQNVQSSSGYLPHFAILPAKPLMPAQYVPSNQAQEQVTGLRYCAFCGTLVPLDGQNKHCPQCGAGIQE